MGGEHERRGGRAVDEMGDWEEERIWRAWQDGQTTTNASFSLTTTMIQENVFNDCYEYNEI
jgi:hypothetical protein